MRSRRMLAALAVVAIGVAVVAVTVSRDDGREEIDGIFPFATDTVLVFNDSSRGIIALDIDHSRVVHRPIANMAYTDYGERIAHIGEDLVVGYKQIFAAPIDGGEARSIGFGFGFIPALDDDTVWLFDYEREPNIGMPSLRHVDLEGNVLLESEGLQRHDAQVLREVEGGILYQARGELFVWDPVAEEIITRLGYGGPGDAQGSLVTWCEAQTCSTVHIDDIASGDRVTVDLSAYGDYPDMERSRLSPDGRLFAVQVDTDVVIVETSTGDVRADVEARLAPQGDLAWSPDGSLLFHSNLSNNGFVTDLGVYDVERETRTERRLPFAAKLDALAFTPEDAAPLLDDTATTFATCARDDVTCGARGIHDLVAPLGCDDAVPRSGPWGFDETLECQIDGRFFAWVHTVTEPSHVALGVRQLSDGGTSSDSYRCADGVVVSSPWIIAGDRWIAVARAEEPAKTIAAALGGEIQPGSGTVGPPVSYLGLCGGS